MSGLYLHVPFCKQACSYCDFYFVTQKGHIQDFVDTLIREIKHKQNSRLSEETVRTIYFGGGTPSLLSGTQIEAILHAIQSVFETDLQEVTLEMNPDDVTQDFLSDLKQAGVDRASMGVQSFDQELLNFMHRAHNSKEALRCLELLKASAFKVFTTDLIYGNPGQSLRSLEKDLDILLGFDPPHVSAYSLTVEPQTRLGKQVKLGRILPPEDDTVSDHFDLVVDKLGAHGIRQYEVSNYAVPGKEAVHNSSYWQHENYLGFGPGAHSFWWDEHREAAVRWSNEKNLKSYLNDGWKTSHESEELDLKDLAEERLMLGLRTKKGLSLDTFKSDYRYSFNHKQLEYIHRLQINDLAEKGDTLRLTHNGLKIADSILLDLLTR